MGVQRPTTARGMMHTFLLAGALVALMSAPVPCAAQGVPTDSAAVAMVVRQFHEALAHRDSAGALALLADDVVVLEAGGLESRAEYRSHHLPADMAFAAAVPRTPGPLRVTLAGDVAWVASTSETTGTFDGRAVNSAGAELVVLSRSPAGWRIRAIHWSSRRR